MSILTKILLSFLASLVLAVGGTSTYAIWIYAKDPAEGAGAQGTVGMAAFEYAPEEVLPDTPPRRRCANQSLGYHLGIAFQPKNGHEYG